MALTTPRSARATPARRDAWCVVAITLAAYVLAGALQLQERVSAYAMRFEAWQLDELPFTLTALSLGLAWYAWRRRAETRALLAHNRELAARLIELQEHERRALARELHDELAQACTSIRLEAAYILRERDPQRIAEAARRSDAAACTLHDGVRRLLRRLRPADLDELGLPDALRTLCDAQARRSGVSCRVEAGPGTARLGADVDIAVYRIAQEAIGNALRHARPERIAIELRTDGRRVELNVDDDGAGFDPTRRTRGLGLIGIAERAAALGGALQAISAPGRGCRIAVQLPLRAHGPLRAAPEATP